MSRYTTEVRFICESEAGLTESAGFNDIDRVLTIAAPKVFNFNFPLFDEAYRLVLEKKILRHYYTREIGFETVGLWKLKLQDKLCMIMPYYNKLYESELITFNPLYDHDITRTGQRVNDGTNQNAGNSERVTDNERVNSTTRTGDDTTVRTENGLHWNLFSDTPQGGIQGVDDNTYLSNARKETDNNTINNVENYNEQVDGTENFDGNETINTQNTETIHNTEDYLEHVVGKASGASYSKMLKEYRETFLNIDKMIVEELSDLFLGLWM